MAEKTTTAPDPSDAAASAPATLPAAAPPTARRTVTVPVLPFAIIGGLLVAALFFGGGLALGVAIGDHHPRVAMIQPFSNRSEPFGGQNGFGPNERRNGGQPGFGPNGGQPGFGPNSGQPGSGQNGGQPGGQNPQPTPAPTNG